MQLSIKDRIVLLQLLPAQNTLLDYTLKQSIIKKVNFTDSDFETYAITKSEDSNTIQWDKEKDAKLPLTVDFTVAETEYLAKACEAASEMQLTDDIWESVNHIYANK